VLLSLIVSAHAILYNDVEVSVGVYVAVVAVVAGQYFSRFDYIQVSEHSTIFACLTSRGSYL